MANEFVARNGLIAQDTSRITGSLLVTQGNVGIGTASPGAKLQVAFPANITNHVFKSEAGDNLLALQTFPTTDRIQLLVGSYNGTATPTIASISDTNTGIQFSGADILRFVNNGSENVTINAVGNVGIGTTSPAYKLDVSGSIRIPNNNYLYINSVAGTATQVLTVDTGDNTILNTPASGDIYVRSNGTTIVRIINNGDVNLGGTSATSSPIVKITTGGNVGIGSTSPAYKLDINGITRFQDIVRFKTNSWNLSDDGFNRFYFANAGRTYFGAGSGYEWRSAADSALAVLLDGGNLGIGTTSPTVRLEVSQTDNTAILIRQSNAPAANRYSQLVLTQGSSTFGASDKAYQLISYGLASGETDFVIQYWNGSSYNERLRLDSAGNVGIGTTNPSLAKLQVQGNIWAQSFTGSFSGSTAAPGSNTQVIFNSSGSLAASSSFIFNGANVGIGTTTLSQRLSIGSADSDAIIINVGGKLYFRDTSTSIFEGSGLNLIAGSSRPMIFSADGSERMRIALGGNVGIGTSSPSYKLHVSGGSEYIEGGFGANTSIAYTSTNRLIFNNDYSDTARGPNKITLYDSSWLGGFGIHSDTLAYYAGGNHRWYQATNATNAAHLMTLTPTGNLGIGSTAPTQKLVVVGTSSTYIQVNNGTNNVYFGKISGAGTIQSDDDITFRPSSTELMRLTATNVGIGTTSPSAKLQVSGSSNTVNVKGSGSALFSVDGTAGRLFQVDDSLSGSLFSVNTAAGLPVIEAFSDNTVRIGQFGQRALFVSQSKVGIGLENPTANLHVSGTTGGVFEVDGRLGVNALYVSASGIVGIGTTTPGATLDVIGNVRAQSFTGSFSGSIAAPGSNTNVIYNSSGVLAASNNFVFNGTNVGIGTTSPESQFHIFNSTNLGGTSGDYLLLKSLQNPGGAGGNNAYERTWAYRTGAGTDWTTWSIWTGISIDASFNTPTISKTWYWRDPFAGKQHFGNSTTNVMTIGPSNVGIGTTSPSYKLEVSGSSAFSATGVFSLQRVQNIGSAQRQIVITSGGVNAANISTANNIICIGPSSGATLSGSGADSIIAIGVNAAGSVTTGGSLSIHIGRNSGNGITTGNNNVIICSSNQTNIPESTDSAIHILTGGGYEGDNAARALGGETTQYAFIGGGNTHPRYTRRFYFGGGPFVTVPQNANIDFYAPSATGSTDQQGANFTLNAGRGTGTGTPGDFIVATSSTGSSGVVSQTLSSRVWIKGNSGFVGIGTSSPVAKLDIVDTGILQTAVFARGADTNFRLVSRQDNSTNANGSIVGEFGIDYTSTRNAAIRFHRGISTTGGFISFTTNNGSEVARIENTGNVGIGTTTASLAKLQVQGNIWAQSFTGSFSGSVAAAGSNTQVIYNSSGVLAGSNNFVFDGGNVGIGTTSVAPFSGLFGGRLVVEGGTGNLDGAFISTNNASAAELILSKRNPTNSFGSLLIQHSGSSGDAIAINYGVNMTTGTGGVNSFKVTTGGNGYFAGSVGIGTTSPQTSLTLNRTNVSYAGQLQIASDNFAQISFYTSAAITPSATNRKASIIYNIAGNTFEIANQITSGHLILQGTDSGGGNVGIGTDSPAYKLDVNGTVRVTTLIETSSKRYKKNIKKLSPSLPMISSLRPVTFNWKDKAKGEDLQYGLIAEEVLTVIPEAVSVNDKGEAEAISYTKLIPVLIKAVQELQTKVEKLEKQLSK